MLSLTIIYYVSSSSTKKEFDFDMIYKTGCLHYAPDCLSWTPAADVDLGAAGVHQVRALTEEQKADPFWRSILNLLNGQSSS